MASVYTNDLRLEEIGSGEQSGTWGDTTNTNLELIAEAFSFGTEAITTNADTHTTTIADGSTDPGRSIYLKYTGTLDSACTITLGPNTVSKVWFIENATSGSQNIIISQGSGANVTIGNGAVKMVYSDGAGSGAAVVDALVDLDLTGTTTIAAANISGDLDVDGTTNLDVVDIDGAVDMASTLGVSGVLTANAGVKVDNITIDGTEIDLSSGSLTIDVAGAIELDSDTGVIDFDDDTLNFGRIENSSSDFKLESRVQDKDIIFTGNDGGSGITALTLDMSEAGAATFNSTVSSKGLTSSTSGTSNFIAGVNAGDAIQSGGNYNVLIGDEAGTAITTGDNNVAVGYKALEAEDNYGYNVAVGSESLMTLAATSADAYSTAVGYQSGKLTDTGLYNTFVGAQSGRGNTSASNNVGMGNASLYTNQLGSNNVAIGVQALNTMNPSTSTDTFNTAVGYQAMQDATTVIQTTAVGGKSLNELTTGNYNVAVGMEALEETTVGDYNTAVGTYALKTNVNGDRSTAFGYGALFSQGPSTATNADYQNVAMGMHAGYNISTGKKNVYIGYEAANGDGSNKATGDDNVFIGNEAGHDITTGGSNVLIGSFAGDKVTTGVYNVALGTNALGAATTDNNSTAIGQQSLGSQNTTTDSHNVGCGYLTGYYLTTGTANTFVGSLAGYGSSSTALTGTSNTCVGYRAGHVLQGAGSSNVLVGNNAGLNVTTGTENVVMGVNAGDALTSTSHTTAIGTNALSTETTGTRTTVMGSAALFTQNRAGLSDPISYNTVIGYAAGYYCSTAQSITAVGYSALDSVNTGNNNTGIGVGAGQNIQGAENNTAIGHAALYNNNDGDENTAVGAYALYHQDPSGAGDTEHVAVGFNAGYNITTGSGNTVVGYKAGAASGSASTGGGNTCLGRLAGYSLTSGGYNICIGYIAGDLITEGDSNICIGSDTGSVTNNLTTGSKNILIGNNCNGPTTTDNAIAIGDGVVVSANDFSFGKVGNVVTNDFDTDANWSRSSDVRKKREIYDQNLGLDFINDLRTVSFQWKPSNEFPKEWYDYSEENTMNTDVVMHGFIAQEVKEALDKHASERDSNFSGWKEGSDGMQHTSREMFVIPLIKAVQELSLKVTELQEEIKVLKGE